MNAQIPLLIEKFVGAVNSGDAATLINLFAEDATVLDAGRQIEGIEAIKKWCVKDIFDVNVTLGHIEVSQVDEDVVLKTKVDGTFDRTGLPNPLFIDHYFRIDAGKIERLRCELAQ